MYKANGIALIPADCEQLFCQSFKKTELSLLLATPKRFCFIEQSLAEFFCSLIVILSILKRHPKLYQYPSVC